MYNEKKAKRQTNVYVTLLVILMTVAVVVAVAGAVAKNMNSPSKTDDGSVLREDMAKKETSAADTVKKEPRHDAEEEVTDSVTEKEEVTDAPETDKTDVFSQESLPDFVPPADGAVQKKFSIDVPVFSLTMEDYRTHDGVDIAAAIGAEVKAAADGTVKEVWADPMMGTCICISHAGNSETVYKGISDVFPDGIKSGAAVSAGDVIGTVSDSALEEIAEESHLHFEMTVNGETVNPCDYIVFPDTEVFEG